MRIRKMGSIAALSVAFLAMTSCISFSPRAKYVEHLDWTLEREGVAAISAQGINGSISIVGADQGPVTVSARKEVRARTEAAAEEFAQEVQIHVEQHGNELRIYEEHPKWPKRM